MGHNYNDSINFSFKKDLETIKSLPKEKRWKYIWDYYKIIILVLPVALIVLLILGSFCVNMVKGTFFPKDPVSIGIAVSGYSAYPDWLQNCEEAIGYDPKREYLQILESPPYSTERDDFVIKSTLWLTAGPFSGYSGRSVPGLASGIAGAFCRIPGDRVCRRNFRHRLRQRTRHFG